MKKLKHSIGELITVAMHDIEEKVKREREHVAFLEELGALWPQSVEVSRVFLSKLWGSRGVVSIGDKSWGLFNRDNDTRNDHAQIAALLDALPPLPLVRVNDGCVSLRPELTISEALWLRAEEDESGTKIETGIWGAFVEIDPGGTYQGSQSVKWYAAPGWTDRTKGPPMIVRVECPLKPEDWPIDLPNEVRHDRRTGTVAEVTTGYPSPRGNFWMDQRIRYAAGGATGGNRHVFYWLGIDDSPEAGGPGLAWLDQIGASTVNPPKEEAEAEHD